jgi:hypothetical protein
LLRFDIVAIANPSPSAILPLLLVLSRFTIPFFILQILLTSGLCYECIS